MITNLRDRLSLLDAYRPSLVSVGTNLVAACFPLMKIYPAYMCVERAIMEGVITPNSLIVESSSGTMALGLAIVCQWSGYKLTIVSDPACDSLVQTRLADLGVTIEIVDRPAAVGGYQRARLNRLHEICSATKDSWWVNQYDNLVNAQAYSKFAAQLIEALGRIDCLVGTVGSGGSVCGTAGYLRMLFPDLRVIGVDTFGSVLFGQADAPRILRGLGNSLLPKNLDHTVFDEVHWVTAAEAYTATRMLHRATALFRGGTSGACWQVARYWSDHHPEMRTVCLFPDDGHRYLDTIYNDSYMDARKLRLSKLPAAPQKIDSPRDVHTCWSYMEWGRRCYEEVVGQPSVTLAEPNAISASY